MVRFQCRRMGCFLAVGLLSVAVQAAWAQRPRARTLTYDPDRKEWVETSAPPPGTSAGDLHNVRTQIRQGRYRSALSEVKAFLKKYGESDPSYAQILIAKADALVGLREYSKAHVALQTFLSEFGGGALTSEALRLEFVIAEAYLAGAKRKLLGVRVLSGVDLAYQILDEISSNYPDSRLAELAIKAKADHLFLQGDHELAEFEYARLLRDHPRSRYNAFALRRSADASLAGFGGVDYDDSALVDAADRYGEYRLRYPVEAERDDVVSLLDTIRQMQAGKDFSIGQYYERTKHLNSAVFYYRSVREHWPETIAAAKATSRLQLLGALQAASSVGQSEGDER